LMWPVPLAGAGQEGGNHMRMRGLILSVVLLGFGSLAWAQGSLLPPDTSGCQVIAPFAWFDLAPGTTWRMTVDLSQCTSSDFGWYDFYGFIMRPGGADSLAVKDGIVLKARNMQSGETAVCTSSGKVTEDVYTQVSAPGQFLLTAENTGRRAQTIRLTWL